MRDAGSVTGKNIRNMTNEFKEDPRMWTSKSYGHFVTKTAIPQNETWKLELLKEMLEERHLTSENSAEEQEIIQFFIETLATIQLHHLVIFIILQVSPELE